MGDDARSYRLVVYPFAVGTDRECAVCPLEEAAEAFGAWRGMQAVGSDASAREATMYECCDTIQAACNLLDRLGATQEEEVERTMRSVRYRNERRGRYGAR